MIMRPGQPLLLPASPLFIWFSLLGALALNMLMNMGPWGRSTWVPDLLALGGNQKIPLSNGVTQALFRVVVAQAAGGFDPALWQGLAGLGTFAMRVPEGRCVKRISCRSGAVTAPPPGPPRRTTGSRTAAAASPPAAAASA